MFVPNAVEWVVQTVVIELTVYQTEKNPKLSKFVEIKQEKSFPTVEGG